MAAPSFDLLIFGRRQLAAAGSSPGQGTLTKVRLRIVQQVFNNRRVVYRNRVESNRKNFLLTTIENAHNREQATQRLQKQSVLTDLKRKNTVVDSSFALSPSYEPIDLTEPKDFYRFGVRVHSAGPHVPLPTRSNRTDRDRSQPRTKSASILSRPYTTPLRTFNPEDTDSDDETVPVFNSRATSGKPLHDRVTSAVSSSIVSQPAPELPTTDPQVSTSASHRITWPVRLKVFTLQDENETRQQMLAWRAEQRKNKVRRSSKQFFDVKLEQQYYNSIRRRQEIEAFVTPDLIEEHQRNDPVFAKRYRQLQLAIRAGKTPNYDVNDRAVNLTMTKSKMERARTALISAKQSKLKDIYRNQQRINDANLSQRIDTFLKRIANLQEPDQ